MSTHEKYFTKAFQTAQNYGQIMAYKEFISMLNPVNRGPAFKWETFPDRIARLAERSVYMCFSDEAWADFKQWAPKDAASAARTAAKWCIEVSGITASETPTPAQTGPSD